MDKKLNTHDLSSIPTGAVIQEATLYLYTGFMVSQTSEIQRHYCSDNNWQELGITWNNKPVYESRTLYWVIAKASTWYGLLIDSKDYDPNDNCVTRAIKNPDKKLTIVLSMRTDTGALYFDFLSRDQEYSWMKEYIPYLVVKYGVASPSTITCIESKNNLVLGESISISGSIRPAVSSQTVKITYTGPDNYLTDRTVQTNTNGDYVDTFTLQKVGSWSVRASWVGNADYQGASSLSLSFIVVEPPKRGSLKILVQDDKGAPLSGVLIASTSQPLNQPVLTSYSGSDGTYTFSNIIVGSYTIKASRSEYSENSVQLTVYSEQTISQTIQLNKLLSKVKIFALWSNR